MTRVLGSYGMGADSTAVVLRWIDRPELAPCPLAGLTLVTAMTGDEWPVTGYLVTEHIVPRLAEHGIRYVQLARAGPRQSDGVVVLDDSRAPEVVHLGGAYTLSQEMLAAGTVPQYGGCRRCSLKAKGWVIDTWASADLGGEPYLHVMGYEAGEAGRIVKDRRYDTAQRTGVYPLQEWGWTRADCESYIHDVTGVWWPKSACTYCPFALATGGGRDRVLAAFAAEPTAGVRALVMERVSVSLNPKQSLGKGWQLHDLLAGTGQHQAVLAGFERDLDRLPWHIFDVRRAFRALEGDASKAANLVRSVTTLAVTTRDRAGDELAAAAAAGGLTVTVQGGVTRAWARHRGATYPTAERCLVACPVTPDGPFDKVGPKFAEAWTAALDADDGTLPIVWAA
jgi:hypothetical protein